MSKTYQSSVFSQDPEPARPVRRSGSHTSNVSKDSPFSNSTHEVRKSSSIKVFDRKGHTPAPESIFSKQPAAPKVHAPYTGKKNQSTWASEQEVDDADEQERQRVARATAAKKNQSSWNPAHAAEAPEPVPVAAASSGNPLVGDESAGSIPGLGSRGAVKHHQWSASNDNPLTHSEASPASSAQPHFGKRRSGHALTETTPDNPLAPGTFERPQEQPQDFKQNSSRLARGPSREALSSANNPLALASGTDQELAQSQERASSRKVAPDRNRSALFGRLGPDEEPQQRPGIRVVQEVPDTRSRIFEAPAAQKPTRQTATFQSSVFSGPDDSANGNANNARRKNPTFNSSKDAPWG